MMELFSIHGFQLGLLTRTMWAIDLARLSWTWHFALNQMRWMLRAAVSASLNYAATSRRQTTNLRITPVDSLRLPSSFQTSQTGGREPPVERLSLTRILTDITDASTMSCGTAQRHSLLVASHFRITKVWGWKCIHNQTFSVISLKLFCILLSPESMDFDDYNINCLHSPSIGFFFFTQWLSAASGEWITPLVKLITTGLVGTTVNVIRSQHGSSLISYRIIRRLLDDHAVPTLTGFAVCRGLTFFLPPFPAVGPRSRPSFVGPVTLSSSIILLVCPSLSHIANVQM